MVSGGLKGGECGGAVGEDGGTDLGQIHPAGQAVEEGALIEAFQLADLQADGGGRAPQLLRGCGKAAVAGAGLECADGVQGRQASGHGRT